MVLHALTVTLPRTPDTVSYTHLDVYKRQVNKNMVPFDDKSPFVTSGIRIGTPAITSRGLKEKDCLKVVDFIDAALKNKDNTKELGKIKAKVNTMMEKYPLFKD